MSGKFLTNIVLAAGLSRRMGEENKLLLPLDGTTILSKTLSNILPSQLGETLVVVGHEAEDIVKALALNFRFQISDFSGAIKPNFLNLKDLGNLESNSGERSENFKSSPNVGQISDFKFQISDSKVKSSSPLNFKLLLNDNYEKGMTTSIQTGVQAANEGSSGYMICLSDMPFITPSEYQFLANAFFSILERDKQAIVQPVFEEQRGNPTIFSNVYKKDILDLTYTEGCKPIVQTHKAHLYLVDMPTDSVVKDIDFRQEYDHLSQL